METIDIVVLTCNRLELLNKVITGFKERLKTPYRLIIINNNSKDGTTEYIEKLGVETIHNKDGEERGLCAAYTQSLPLVKSELFITTQDDILIPEIEPDVLSQLIDLFNRNPEYGAICLRTVDMKRGPAEGDELIRRINTCPGVFRIQRKSDMMKTGGFGNARRWEDSEMNRIIINLGKKTGIASNLWARDIGLAADRGYPEWYRKSVVGNYNKNFEWVNRPRRQRNIPEVNPKTHQPI